jgi:glycosyltransferase involved in cell wall biosynthesis
MKIGWLVNDTLTCIPGTKTFWHDLLDWLPNLQDKCNGLTSFSILPEVIENKYENDNKPDYIIRNASYFRKLNIKAKTICLLQDILHDKRTQLDVCNNSDIVVFNSPYTKHVYDKLITVPKVVIPLGVNFNKFIPMQHSFSEELNILPDSILFIGSATNNPKGFDILLDIIANTTYNFCLVMKDDYVSNNSRVKVFNKVDHIKLVKIMNSCKMLICTSRIETLHLAGVEAAACNLPIVTTNVGIYHNLFSGKWGRNIIDATTKAFIEQLEYVFNNYSYFQPRDTFYNLGLDILTCKKKWIHLINSL